MSLPMMDDHRVILEVQRHRILYDPANPFYKDNLRKEQAWTEVATALRADPADCKTRWRMLRDSFVKYQKKVSTSTLDPGNAPRDWKYHSSMAFILPFIQNRATKRRAPLLADSESERSGRPSSQDPSLPAGPSSSSSPLAVWNGSVMEEDQPSVSDSDREEIYHFVMSTVPQLLRLGKRKRRRAKLEILQTLDRFEEDEESLTAAKRQLCPPTAVVYRPESTGADLVLSSQIMDHSPVKKKSAVRRTTKPPKTDRRSRFWIHPFNRQRRRQGDFYHLVQELRVDSERHYQYFRMSAEKMDALLDIVGPDLTRQCTTYRAAIEPKQRLAVGMRYLASGDTFASLAFSYRLGESTVRNSVYMVCRAIEQTMMAHYLPPPTEDTWKEVAEGFVQKWNFPNCLGALDGKNIVIEKPPNSGSMYSHYKKTFSVVLMALVDSDYRFRVINVGDSARAGEGSIYASSALGIGMEEGTLHVPPRTPFPGWASGTPQPYVIVADAAFPLRPYLMRPYCGTHLDHNKKVFNNRLSKARTVVDSAFSILTSRWKIFHRRINLLPHNVDSVVMASCILHNYLLSPVDSQKLLEESQQQVRRLQPLTYVGEGRTSCESTSVRDAFCAYFCSPAGTLPVQETAGDLTKK